MFTSLGKQQLQHDGHCRRTNLVKRDGRHKLVTQRGSRNPNDRTLTYVHTKPSTSKMQWCLQVHKQRSAIKRQHDGHCLNLPLASGTVAVGLRVHVVCGLGPSCEQKSSKPRHVFDRKIYVSDRTVNSKRLQHKTNQSDQLDMDFIEHEGN